MVAGTPSEAPLKRGKGLGWNHEESPFSLLGSFGYFLQTPPCLFVCVCVCVVVWTCVRACMSEKEGALAPESALWGDHSCTLPAANWSLSSCPIHLHFLPITEHYLCSQLGMGLNPFWLSWCYSLQISNGDGEGHVWAAGWGVVWQNKVQNFPSSPVKQEALIGRPKMEAINYWGYNSIQCRLIDSRILIPLALIDLLKPYFLIIGGFTLGNVSQGRR